MFFIDNLLVKGERLGKPHDFFAKEPDVAKVPVIPSGIMYPLYN